MACPIPKSGGILALLFALGLGLACASPFSREAEEAFLADTGPFSVTIYPVHVVLGQEIEDDALLAVQLAEFLSGDKLANPTISESPIEVPMEWGRNQAAMYRRSGERFGAAVAAAGIETEYALLVEILCDDEETWVGGVHYYLVDAGGQLASGGGSNSHHKEFKEVDPVDREGGIEVAFRMLADRLREGR
jgi:hypothetical protein